MRIDGKVVLITGASEGIGAACAREFANSGARLSLVARRLEGLERAARREDLVTAGDLTTDEARRRAVDRTLERFGAIDILINNAGIGTYAPSWEMPMEDARYLMELNFFVPLALSQLVAPHMRQRHSGMIVNVGSIGGKVVLPWMTLYSVTKSALGGADGRPARRTHGLRRAHHAGLSGLREDRISSQCAGRSNPRKGTEGAPLRDHSRRVRRSHPPRRGARCPHRGYAPFGLALRDRHEAVPVDCRVAHGGHQRNGMILKLKQQRPEST